MPQHADTPVHIPFAEGTRHGACIKVVSVGGGGNNAINRMIDLGLDGVEFISLNSDFQSLMSSKAQVRLQVGTRLTHGPGVGADPERGRKASLEESDKLVGALDGADMVFITAGLGGETGTSVAPFVASIASKLGALTVAIVTLPFAFEGRRRMNRAERGLLELLDHVDTLIVIPNDRLLASAKDIRFFQSFQIADDILRQAVQGISDIITVPGVINCDFADIKTTMAGMGYGVMGTASHSGPHRASDAAVAAISSPLLAPGAILGARGVLITIAGSNSLRLSEVHAASTIIQRAAHEDANIIFGAILDERLGAEVKVTVIATGFDQKSRDHAQRRLLMRSGLERTAATIPAQSPTESGAAMQSAALAAVDPEGEITKSPSPEIAAEGVQELALLLGTFSVLPGQSEKPSPVVRIPPETSTSEHFPEPLINDERESAEPPIPQIEEDTSEEDLLTFIEGLPFDLSLAGERATSSSVPEIQLETEIARVRRAAIDAYAATSFTEIVNPEVDNEGAPNFADVLKSRRQILGFDRTESHHLADEQTPRDQTVTLHGEYFPSEETRKDESESESDILEFQKPPEISEVERPSESDLAHSHLIDRPDGFTPVAAEPISLETPSIPLKKTKRQTPDFNQKLHREPDFSMGIKVI